MARMSAQASSEQEREEEEGTPQGAFVRRIEEALSRPCTETLNALWNAKDNLLASKERGCQKLALMGLARVFCGLLPSYTIAVTGFKYNHSSQAGAYEFALAKSWQGYLKMVTRSKLDESFLAAAALLPHTILFNKSAKLAGKVIRGAGKKGDLGKRCASTLKAIFRCDTGGRIVRILEVVNQLPLEKLSRRLLKTLLHINDEALRKPEVREIMEEKDIDMGARKKIRKRYGRGKGDNEGEEDEVANEVKIYSRRKRIKTWRGLNDRLLRTYLTVLTAKDVRRYMFVLLGMKRLHVPGNLHEGVFTVISEIIAKLKKDPTPGNVVVLSRCYDVLRAIFSDKLDFSFQLHELENIPLGVLVSMDDDQLQEVYSSLRSAERLGGTPELVKLLIRRGMYRPDFGLAAVVRHLMPPGGQRALEVECQGGFWELSLIRPRAQRQ